MKTKRRYIVTLEVLDQPAANEEYLKPREIRDMVLGFIPKVAGFKMKLLRTEEQK